jgi:hypothetical protein
MAAIRDSILDLLRRTLGEHAELSTSLEPGIPCEAEFHGDKADEVIKAQDRHLKEMVADGDEAHRDAFDDMQGRWKHPISGMGWYRKTKKEFAALPDS